MDAGAESGVEDARAGASRTTSIVMCRRKSRTNRQAKGNCCCDLTPPSALILIVIQMAGEERLTVSEMEVDMDEVIYQKRGGRTGASRRGS